MGTISLATLESEFAFDTRASGSVVRDGRQECRAEDLR